jgi:hypothetical protein
VIAKLAKRGYRDSRRLSAKDISVTSNAIHGELKQANYITISCIACSTCYVQTAEIVPYCSCLMLLSSIVTSRGSCVYKNQHLSFLCNVPLTIRVSSLSIVHSRQLVFTKLILVFLMRSLERLEKLISHSTLLDHVIRLTATHERMVVDIGAGSETRGAKTSASNLAVLRQSVGHLTSH